MNGSVAGFGEESCVDDFWCHVVVFFSDTCCTYARTGVFSGERGEERGRVPELPASEGRKDDTGIPSVLSPDPTMFPNSVTSGMEAWGVASSAGRAVPSVGGTFNLTRSSCGLVLLEDGVAAGASFGAGTKVAALTGSERGASATGVDGGRGAAGTGTSSGACACGIDSRIEDRTRRRARVLR